MQTDIPVLFLSARDEDEARLRGLGLRIVKRIVAAHRGRICLQNIPTGGCRCTILLKV